MVIGILIVASLLGLMFMRSGRDEVIETKWNEATLPVHDAVANSMYGGAQEIFQQPVAHAAPVAHQHPVAHVAPIATPQVTTTQITYNIHDSVVSGDVTPGAPAPAPVAVAGPPLPPSGLPAGWTMEQWAYYGQQYLDQMNQY